MEIRHEEKGHQDLIRDEHLPVVGELVVVEGGAMVHLLAETVVDAREMTGMIAAQIRMYVDDASFNNASWAFR